MQISDDFNIPDILVTGVNSETARKASFLGDFINVNGLHQLNNLKNEAENIVDFFFFCQAHLRIMSHRASQPLVSIDEFHPPFTVSCRLPAHNTTRRSSSVFNFMIIQVCTGTL